jgi:hypothetical protein
MSDNLALSFNPSELIILLDCETVRLQVPPLKLAGNAEPLLLHLDFNAELVDEIQHRLTVLRAQMLPAPTRN